MTEYNTLKPLVTKILTQQLSENISEVQLNQFYSYVEFKCKTEDSIEIPLGIEDITVKCSDMEKVTQENFIPFISDRLFDSIYYKKYDCEVIDCIRQKGQQGFLVLVSEHGNNFLKSIKGFLWLLTGIFAIIFFLAIETFSGKFKGFGMSLIFTSIPFFVFYYLKDFIPSELFNLSPQLLQIVNDAINQLFDKMMTNFLIVFIVGIVLTIVGYLVFGKRKKLS